MTENTDGDEPTSTTPDSDPATERLAEAKRMLKRVPGKVRRVFSDRRNLAIAGAAVASVAVFIIDAIRTSSRDSKEGSGEGWVGGVEGLCSECGIEFDVADARHEYNSEYGFELDYDEDFEGYVCATCAIEKNESAANHGRAIFMMNGDEDYDADHVEKYL